jgi:hypothetical protein
MVYATGMNAEEDEEKHLCIGHMIMLNTPKTNMGILYCKKCHKLFYLTDCTYSLDSYNWSSRRHPTLSQRYDLSEVPDELAEVLKETYKEQITEAEPYKTRW